jgi:cysteine desulfurase
VLTALGLPPGLATAALRFSFSAANTPSDVDAVIAELPVVVDKVRNLSTVLER